MAGVTNAAGFVNDHHIGRYVYQAAAAVASAAALYMVAAVLTELALPYCGLAGLTAIVIGVAVSWLRPFRVLFA